jgi:hypothetical protein
MNGRPQFRNLLRKEPKKRYTIVSDVETKGICTIRRTWLDLVQGKFYYPPPQIMSKKTLKEVGEPNLLEWYEYTLDYIYAEAGN